LSGIHRHTVTLTGFDTTAFFVFSYVAGRRVRCPLTWPIYLAISKVGGRTAGAAH
jgi:hypothetical protein